jgi:hypothetical protein
MFRVRAQDVQTLNMLWPLQVKGILLTMEKLKNPELQAFQQNLRSWVQMHQRALDTAQQSAGARSTKVAPTGGKGMA